jgi:hypothetical protein
MYGLVKSAALGAALLTGVALAAQAQAVSTSPAAGGAPGQPAPSHPFGPKPGGGGAWKEQPAQLPADYKTNPKYHPYSTHGMGPQADSPYTGSPPPGGKAHSTASGSTQGPKTN